MRRLGTMTAMLVLVICTLAPPGARAQGVVSLVSRATPSVAYVVSFGTDGKPHESGTAFAIGNGLLLTALHVVATATKVTVQFPTQTAVAADVVEIDTEQDVAVLHLAETPPSVPAALPLASSAAVQLGESVTVLGYPLASPEHPTLTVTQGIVSALNVESKFLQIDAPINPGNSGGPVLAADGRVIGIVDASVLGAQNFNLAVPIDVAQPLVAHAPGAAPLPLPLTTTVTLTLTHTGNDIGPTSHQEAEAVSCVDAPPHAAYLNSLTVALNVERPLHMIAWLSWKRGLPVDNPGGGVFGAINDSVAPEMIRPLTDLSLPTDRVCLNYDAWNETSQRAGRKFTVTYTLGYLVFTTPSTTGTSASH
ncbi:MAG TPA: S1C family serine protease [bacterium]|nr:S1C family serine protease [bacterium]